MKEFTERFFYSDAGAAHPESVYTFHGVRFTVLTSRLLRVERSVCSVFCDLPTQTVVDRRFERPAFCARTGAEKTVIRTDACEFCYSHKTHKMLYITLQDGRRVTDYTGENLKGTCRTLDGTFGAAKLGDGVISKNGVAVLDDGASLTVLNDGRILPRKCGEEDQYYFAYGFDYRAAIADFFRLTGMPPMIPRFALGNWWSRYKAYTQQEYIDLMERFREKDIPITVATIDMDWHWVDVVKRFGKEARDRKPDRLTPQSLFYIAVNPGWTGYSWNTELFPDPKGFLAYLKRIGCRVTVNLHPASGCKFYEDAYAEFARFMGVDPATKKQLRFDVTDPRFMEGYFRFLHHPMEADGVDFWWIDWQQGKRTAVPGLDPLWALNHYHYLDNGRDGKRPLILSRYAGPGSHRYPLGFSGDTAQNWEVLRFQPYFTATAANIGYTWWSHDIGGHHFGKRDDELYLRWVQFGVFSPVMRLHSTSNEFMGKEPWKYRADVEFYAGQAMRLRHRMIPYLYTMARLCSLQGRALCEPMYYAHPKDERAYGVPNEYAFGTELIVCPITEPIDPDTGVAGTKAFLPKGTYTDIFTGRLYKGDLVTEMFRDESAIPVLARAGAIIPLSNDPGNSVGNPKSLEILIFNGDSTFTLYEDNDRGEGCRSAETKFAVSCGADSVRFAVSACEGDAGVLPEKRNFTFSFRNVAFARRVRIIVGEKRALAQTKVTNGVLQVSVRGVSPSEPVEVLLEGVETKKNPQSKELRIEAISKLQGPNAGKMRLIGAIDDSGRSRILPKSLRRILAEFDALLY